MDMSQYKDLFVSEVREHLQGMNEAIVALEGAPAEREQIDYLFRMAHSIKGMAASMGYGEMAELAHKMEDLMDRVRKGSIDFVSTVADLLLEGSDLLSRMLSEIDGGGSGQHDILDLVQRLAGYTPTQIIETPLPGKEATTESVDQSTTDQSLDNSAPKNLELEIVRCKPESPQNVRVRTEVLDNLVNITGELITHKNRMISLSRDVKAAALTESISDLSRLVRELHDEVLKVRLMPFATAVDRLPRMVRDLAKKSGKEVNFEVSGKEIELDRGIVEELSDPLLHLLRNAVDHGLELPEERKAAGKKPAGTISIDVHREKDRVLITIRDDGKGMDPQRLVSAALEKGLLSPEAAAQLSPQQALMLVCLPGFSTATEITDVSGRGVGMDAVRASVQAIGGNLAIESAPGKGSCFTLSLPLTISIIQILLVACAKLIVGLPVTKVLRTVDMRKEMIRSRGKGKFFQLGDEEIPLVSLHRLLDLPFSPIKGESVPAVIVEMNERSVALVVDRFVGQQDVFVKPFGSPLNRMKGFLGGAILGDGQVIFIIDPANLL
ncbi:MAG: chemotaxis protein CheA [Deltaproteobacteria bacterium]|nr:chemotaxis protein CheA [Deltaproteobacteria bacterium]TLN03437.1 MAG: chemotaxis protein CheA [bacterium]